MAVAAPESLTYDSLIADVMSYADNSNERFVTQLPRLVMLAENRLATDVKGLGLIRVVNGEFISGNPVVDKPARWRETLHLLLTVSGQRQFILPRSYEQCRAYWPDQSVTGTPRFYSDYDYEHLFVVPTPASALDFELAYYERPEPLSESRQSNWTTRYAPQLLLYATLLEAQSFLSRPERVPEFKALYDEAKMAVAKEDLRRGTEKHAAVNRM